MLQLLLEYYAVDCVSRSIVEANRASSTATLLEWQESCLNITRRSTAAVQSTELRYN